MRYGLNRSGFVKKKFSEIADSIFSRISNGFNGYAGMGEIDTQPDSPLGQIVYPISEAISELWEEAQVVYDSNSSTNAEGVNLDSVMDYVGIKRQPATPTEVILGLKRDPDFFPVTVPDGSLFKVSENGLEFVNVGDADLTDPISNLLKTQIEPKRDDPNTVYQVVINDHIVCDYESESFTDFNTIATGLKDSINNNAGEFVTANINPDNPVVIDVYSIDLISVFSLNVRDDWNTRMLNQWLRLLVQCTEDGAKEVLSGQVDTIVTPITNITDVMNFTDGNFGSEIETDQELRLRKRRSLQRSGSSTVGAIESKIRNSVYTVTDIKVFEDLIDNTIEVVVQGGSDEEIASLIMANKPAGILTKGNTSYVVPDLNGDNVDIYFSRIVNAFCFIDVYIEDYNSEEDFPNNGGFLIKKAIVDYGREIFGLGDDLIIQKLYDPIYTVQGLKKVRLEVGIAYGVVNNNLIKPTMQEVDFLTVNTDEKLRFAVNRIDVIDNT